MVSTLCLYHDGFGFGNDYEHCSKSSLFVRNSLTEAGFLINEEKSIFQPMQSMECLGLIWDSKNLSLSITYRRISNVLNSLEFLKNVFPHFIARELAKFASQIICMLPVFGNVCILMTRHIFWR
jgi:hypothetical protein